MGHIIAIKDLTYLADIENMGIFYAKDLTCGIDLRSLEQSRAEHGLTAPFLRLAGRLKLHITFEMDDRRILMGLVYPVRFGGFCRTSLITWNGKEGNPLNECTLCRSG